MAEGWYPGAIRRPITTHEYFLPRTTPIISICDHITDGTDSRDLLQNSDNGSSVHFLVRDEGGPKAVVYQFMPVEWAAWGNGIYSDANPYMPDWVGDMIARGQNINMATVSVEHERKWPFTTTLSNTMLPATTDLHIWLAENYPTIKVDRDHIIGHYQIDHIRRANCPGGPGGKLYPFDTIISSVRGALNPPAPAPDPPPMPTLPRYFTETGQSIGGAIGLYWLSNGGLPVFGYPVSAELQQTIDGQAYTVQYFERARLEWQAGKPVTLGRVGAELYDIIKGSIK